MSCSRQKRERSTTDIFKVLAECGGDTFNTSTKEAQTGESPRLRLAWSAYGVPSQPGLFNEALSQNFIFTFV